MNPVLTIGRIFSWRSLINAAQQSRSCHRHRSQYGGLLAARVLSDYYQRVTLVEKDRLPSAGDHHRGVPQDRHTHGLLAAGYRTLETLFPGIAQNIVEAGGVPVDVVQSGRWFHQGGYLRQVKSGLDGALLSRSLLESIVRSQTLAY